MTATPDIADTYTDAIDILARRLVMQFHIPSSATAFSLDPNVLRHRDVVDVGVRFGKTPRQVAEDCFRRIELDLVTNGVSHYYRYQPSSEPVEPSMTAAHKPHHMHISPPVVAPAPRRHTLHKVAKGIAVSPHTDALRKALESGDSDAFKTAWEAVGDEIAKAVSAPLPIESAAFLNLLSAKGRTVLAESEVMIQNLHKQIADAEARKKMFEGTPRAQMFTAQIKHLHDQLKQAEQALHQKRHELEQIRKSQGFRNKQHHTSEPHKMAAKLDAIYPVTAFYGDDLREKMAVAGLLDALNDAKTTLSESANVMQRLNEMAVKAGITTDNAGEQGFYIGVDGDANENVLGPENAGGWLELSGDGSTPVADAASGVSANILAMSEHELATWHNTHADKHKKWAAHHAREAQRHTGNPEQHAMHRELHSYHAGIAEKHREEAHKAPETMRMHNMNRRLAASAWRVKKEHDGFTIRHHHKGKHYMTRHTHTGEGVGAHMFNGKAWEPIHRGHPDWNELLRIGASHAHAVTTMKPGETRAAVDTDDTSKGDEFADLNQGATDDQIWSAVEVSTVLALSQEDAEHSRREALRHVALMRHHLAKDGSDSLHRNAALHHKNEAHKHAMRFHTIRALHHHEASFRAANPAEKARHQAAAKMHASHAERHDKVGKAFRPVVDNKFHNRLRLYHAGKSNHAKSASELAMHDFASRHHRDAGKVARKPGAQV